MFVQSRSYVLDVYLSAGCHRSLWDYVEFIGGRQERPAEEVHRHVQRSNRSRDPRQSRHTRQLLAGVEVQPLGTQGRVHPSIDMKYAEAAF